MSPIEITMAYDVVRACINDEIARHNAAIYDADPQTERRKESIKCLIEARHLLNHDNLEAIQVALLLVKGIRGHEAL